MIDLARNGKDGFVKLQELSARQQISEKYLENSSLSFFCIDTIRNLYRSLISDPNRHSYAISNPIRSAIFCTESFVNR